MTVQLKRINLNISNTMLNYSEASFLSGDEIGEVNNEQEIKDDLKELGKRRQDDCNK